MVRIDRRGVAEAQGCNRSSVREGERASRERKKKARQQWERRIKSRLSDDDFNLYLYCRKYGLPRNDPRILSATSEEIALDLEFDLALRGDHVRKCEACGAQTYREHCPLCPGSPRIPLTDFDRLRAREEAGETVPWSEYVKGYEHIFLPKEEPEAAAVK